MLESQFVDGPFVAIGPLAGIVYRVFLTNGGKGNFRVLVSPDLFANSNAARSDDRYLVQGVRANGWVLLKEVPLGYEICCRLNVFPPILAKDDAAKVKVERGKIKLPQAQLAVCYHKGRTSVIGFA